MKEMEKKDIERNREYYEERDRHIAIDQQGDSNPNLHRGNYGHDIASVGKDFQERLSKTLVLWQWHKFEYVVQAEEQQSAAQHPLYYPQNYLSNIHLLAPLIISVHGADYARLAKSAH